MLKTANSKLEVRDKAMKLCGEFWVIPFLLGVLAGTSKKKIAWGTKILFMKLLIGTTAQSRSDQEVASVCASISSCSSVLDMLLFIPLLRLLKLNYFIRWHTNTSQAISAESSRREEDSNHQEIGTQLARVRNPLGL